jgi:signal transduction histidine kinase
MSNFKAFRHALAGRLTLLVRPDARDVAFDEVANREQGIVLRLEVPAPGSHVERDGLAIALRNLLENAFKFSRSSDSPTVDIGARRQGHWAILLVRDNGKGFDMKFHDRIFQIFSRLHPSDEHSGTGVGLALVSKAMHRMGGRVWAHSAPAQGSTFFWR